VLHSRHAPNGTAADTLRMAPQALSGAGVLRARARQRKDPRRRRWPRRAGPAPTITPRGSGVPAERHPELAADCAGTALARLRSSTASASSSTSPAWEAGGHRADHRYEHRLHRRRVVGYAAGCAAPATSKAVLGLSEPSSSSAPRRCQTGITCIACDRSEETQARVRGSGLSTSGRGRTPPVVLQARSRDGCVY
jgi:hypothetical protein